MGVLGTAQILGRRWLGGVRRGWFCILAIPDGAEMTLEGKNSRWSAGSQLSEIVRTL